MRDDPLILTAAFDRESHALFQRLRDEHFPAPLNIVPAHLTLFHCLPGGDRDTIVAHLEVESSREATMSYVSPGLRLLGRGVAFEIVADDLAGLRNRLASEWQPRLTRQDRQGFRPHVTIQNKVDAADARSLYERLARSFEPVSGLIIGLDLWAYRGGPWTFIRRFSLGATVFEP